MSAKVCIATPSYFSTVHTWYVASMISYTKVPGLSFVFKNHVGDSLITRARNVLFSEYQFEFNEVGFTHLFWQDDDVYVDGENLLRVAEYGLDVVAIACPLKRYDMSRGISCAVSGVYEEVAPMLYKARYVGTGALLMSNKVVEAITDYCWKNDDIYYETNSPLERYDVFKTGTNNELYLSEDWYLCDLIRSLGFDIYVDSSATCIHADRRSEWVRGPMPVDERCMTDLFRDPLPEDLQLKRWTPSDNTYPIWDTK